ncbi:hypothetical protein [Seohaeicola zhoushanensis]|uniref:Uncharacterized protein n=1 Tax=Seohaeicola zhoushanensis TaxID=1569283 RepID=A0A8J3GXU4_9RHOB|nr:hypothetical protein [Seohaeicola zhoushanensis]GHF50102.1 hypothetical protein GCM10017056_22220 [Seohaeicola zhoushanensis]
MKDIEDLQHRLAAAMDRIAAGVERLDKAQDGGSVESLTEALEEEKLANAQLKERLRALNIKHFDEIGALKEQLADTSERDKLQARLDAQDAAMARLDMDIQRLRQANDQLRSSNAALRAANEAGVGEPHLINKAMLAELEALRASRAADAAEAAAVLAKLEPLLEAAQVNGEGA